MHRPILKKIKPQLFFFLKKHFLGTILLYLKHVEGQVLRTGCRLIHYGTKAFHVFKQFPNQKRTQLDLFSNKYSKLCTDARHLQPVENFLTPK